MNLTLSACTRICTTHHHGILHLNAPLPILREIWHKVQVQTMRTPIAILALSVGTATIIITSIMQIIMVVVVVVMIIIVSLTIIVLSSMTITLVDSFYVRRYEASHWVHSLHQLHQLHTPPLSMAGDFVRWMWSDHSPKAVIEMW